MIKIKQVFADVPNLATGQEISSITVPDGHTYNFVDLCALVEVDTTLDIYIVDENVCTIRGDINDVDPRRHVVNWVLTAGMELRVVAANSAGVTHEMGAGLTYDDVAG